MKGYELIKAITENKIKDNTKIKVTDGILETEIKYKDGGLKWKPEQFNTAFLCSEDMNFEAIEEKKEIEELGFIEETVEYCDGSGYTNTEAASAIDMHKKINELVRAVNKINKQLEEQETEDIDTVERELNKMF